MWWSLTGWRSRSSCHFSNSLFNLNSSPYLVTWLWEAINRFDDIARIAQRSDDSVEHNLTRAVIHSLSRVRRIPISHRRSNKHQVANLGLLLRKNIHRARAVLISDSDFREAGAMNHLNRETVVAFNEVAPHALPKAAHGQMLCVRRCWSEEAEGRGAGRAGGIGGKGGIRTLEGALHPLPA
jgi:hypothetical protein